MCTDTLYLGLYKIILQSLDSKQSGQIEEWRRSYQRSASHPHFMKEAYNSAAPRKGKRKNLISVCLAWLKNNQNSSPQLLHENHALGCLGKHCPARKKSLSKPVIFSPVCTMIERQKVVASNYALPAVAWCYTQVAIRRDWMHVCLSLCPDAWMSRDVEINSDRLQRVPRGVGGINNLC